jgi:2-C-methyl-D-erythritol 2,4-cyclodiphosphate synthase
MTRPDSSFRIGHGYDLHRLEAIAPRGAGRPFVLAGVRFEHPLGPVGHSDGDAVAHAVTVAGYEVGNVDITVICERPKVSQRKAEMIRNLSRHLGCSADRINLKGKTHEGVDAVGEGRAVEVHAVAMLVKG